MDGGEEKEKKEVRKERKSKEGKGTKKRNCAMSRNPVCFFVLHPCGQGKSSLLKAPNLEVPSSFVDPVQDPGTKDALFQEECRQDPESRNQVLGLERVLRVKGKKETTSVSDLPTSVSEGALPGKLVTNHSAKTELRAKAKDAFVTDKRDLAGGNVGARSARGGGGKTVPATAHASAGESKGIAGLLAVKETDFSENSAGAAAAPATACESERNLGLRQVIESHCRVNSSMGVARVRSASAAVAPCAAAVALTCPLASGAVVAVHAT